MLAPLRCVPFFVVILLAHSWGQISDQPNPPRSAPPVTDSSKYQLVTTSDDKIYSIYAEPVSNDARRLMPRVLELRGPAGTLWSKRLPAGLWKATITRKGTFLGCFWRGGFEAGGDGQASVHVIDRDGNVLKSIDMSTRPGPTLQLDPGRYDYAVRHDESEVWLLRDSFTPKTRRISILRHFPDFKDCAETVLNIPFELAQASFGGLVSIPNTGMAAIVCKNSFIINREPLEHRYNVSVAVYGVDSGLLLGTIEVAAGAQRAEAEQVSQNMVGIWGIHSGLCIQIDGRAPGEDSVYALVRVVESDGRGQLLTQYIDSDAAELKERFDLPVVRRLPE